MWTQGDSNPSPHPCHGCALPDELWAQYDANLLLFLKGLKLIKNLSDISSQLFKRACFMLFFLSLAANLLHILLNVFNIITNLLNVFLNVFDVFSQLFHVALNLIYIVFNLFKTFRVSVHGHLDKDGQIDSLDGE